MKIGFTGTQDGMTNRQKEMVKLVLLSIHHDIAEANHGDCIGSDKQFHNIIQRFIPRIKINVHPPIISTKRAFCEGENVVILDEKPYLVRNRNIVDKVSKYGLLLATPKGQEVTRSGTWYTIRHALMTGVNVMIIMP